MLFSFVLVLYVCAYSWMDQVVGGLASGWATRTKVEARGGVRGTQAEGDLQKQSPGQRPHDHIQGQSQSQAESGF